VYPAKLKRKKDKPNRWTLRFTRKGKAKKKILPRPQRGNREKKNHRTTKNLVLIMMFQRGHRLQMAGGGRAWHDGNLTSGRLSWGSWGVCRHALCGVHTVVLRPPSAPPDKPGRWAKLDLGSSVQQCAFRTVDRHRGSLMGLLKTVVLSCQS